MNKKENGKEKEIKKVSGDMTGNRAVHTDLKTVRENERSIRRLKRILAALIVVFVGLVIYASYPWWLPKLDGVFDKPVSTIKNSGDVESGNFPVSLDNDNAGIYEVNNYFMTADSYSITFYDENGKERSSYNHSFSNPVVKTGGKRVLVFDCGSDGFRVYNKSGALYSKTSENTILSGTIGKDGTVGIITESDKYSSSIQFYDEDGKLIYRYDSTQRIMAAAIDDNGGGCYICTFASSDGTLCSQVVRIDFSKDGEQAVSEQLDCIAIDCIKNDDGSVTVVGDTALCILDENGKLKTSYEWNGELLDYALSSGCAAAIVDSGYGNAYTLVTIQSEAEEGVYGTNEMSGFKNAVSVKIFDERVILLTADCVYSYAFSGTLAATAEVSSGYNDFVYINSALYLIDRKEIDKLLFEM